MFIYTENDTEYDKHLKNNNLTHQTYKNTFQQISTFRKQINITNNQIFQNVFIIYQISIIQNLYILHILDMLNMLYILYMFVIHVVGWTNRKLPCALDP